MSLSHNSTAVPPQVNWPNSLVSSLTARCRLIIEKVGIFCIYPRSMLCGIWNKHRKFNHLIFCCLLRPTTHEILANIQKKNCCCSETLISYPTEVGIFCIYPRSMFCGIWDKHRKFNHLIFFCLFRPATREPGIYLLLKNLNILPCVGWNFLYTVYLGI